MSLEASGGGAEQSASAQDAGGATQSCKTWISIKLIDDEAKPVPDEKYRIELPDGRVLEGTLDANGESPEYKELDAGDCKVTFPNLDGTVWDRA